MSTTAKTLLYTTLAAASVHLSQPACKADSASFCRLLQCVLNLALRPAQPQELREAGDYILDARAHESCHPPLDLLVGDDEYDGKCIAPSLYPRQGFSLGLVSWFGTHTRLSFDALILFKDSMGMDEEEGGNEAAGGKDLDWGLPWDSPIIFSTALNGRIHDPHTPTRHSCISPGIRKRIGYCSWSIFQATQQWGRRLDGWVGERVMGGW